MVIRKILFLIIILSFFGTGKSYASEIDSDQDLILNPPQKIIKITKNEYDSKELQKTIDEASIAAKENEENAKKSIIQAEKIVKESDSEALIKVAQSISAIEKSRKEVAKLQLLLTKNIKNTNENLDRISTSLREVKLKYLAKDFSEKDLRELYYESVNSWRILADDSLQIFSNKNLYLKLDITNFGDLSYELPEDMAGEAIALQYKNSKNLLGEEYKNILSLQKDLDRANKNYRSDLLLKSGKLRADILQSILRLDEKFIIYNTDYVDDLVRETKLIPYRPIAVFYTKILQYKATIGSGFSGFFYILKQLGLLIVFVIILLASRRILSKLTSLFDQFGQFCAKESLVDHHFDLLAIVLSKINLYFKWLSLILIFFLIKVILDNSFLSELNILIPYFQYYFLYKIFRIFVHFHLTNLISRNFIQSGKRQLFNIKIRQTTRIIGTYLLGAVFLIELTQTIVRKAYFYNLILELFFFGLLVVLAFCATKWKNEIKATVKNKFSKELSRIVEKLLGNKKTAAVFSLIILCSLTFHKILIFVSEKLKNYDFVKNILSQIYRKKLESASKKIDQKEEILSNEAYLKAFPTDDKNNEFIFVKDQPYLQIKKIISDWLLEKSEENSIAIYGENGIGKSALIEKITTENKDVEIIKLKIDKKIIDKQEFITMASESFGEKTNEKDFFKFLSKINKKSIIVMDDCHNLFLAKEGGFEALKLLFNFLVKIDNPNLLWIASFNSYPWHYLQNAFKIDNYFRHILRMSRWSDENIRELIINKHEKTNFDLIYDPLIFAIHASNSGKEFEDLQQKFFQIIWSGSKGNPSIAISLWLSSINQINEKTIKISLPKSFKNDHLNSLSDNHLFVYSAIIKHHDLSASEISEILSIRREEALNIVRIGLEKGYLDEYGPRNKRFIISSQWQIAIGTLLINRNFIYGQ